MLSSAAFEEKQSAEYAQQTDTSVCVRVLLLPKFENGEMTGDFPGEAQYYYEHYCRGGEEYTVAGSYQNHKLYVRDGVALYVTGCGKVNAVQFYNFKNLRALTKIKNMVEY